MIRPEAGMWRLLVQQNASAEAQRFRKQLGLPTDRPVIMTGHQAQFWHPGILAKYIAADAFAAAIAANRAASVSQRPPSVAFLVVDQDRPAQARVRYPVVEPLGNLGVRETVLGPEGRLPEPPAEPATLPPFVREGLRTIESALDAQRNEPAFARGIALAVRDLLSPFLGQAGRDAALIFATDLCRTDLFGELVQHMAREPERCINAYNAAAMRHSDAGIRTLQANPVQDRWELPLWHLPPGGPRAHVFAEDIGRIPMHELAPKALFMTGLLRLAGCDLFIHGVGGGGDGDSGYDRITDEWLLHWLGDEPSAPITVVTATRRLPVDALPPPSSRDLARAKWRVHHARHHPGEVGLRALEQQRQAVVAEIKAATPHVRAELFYDLHAMLERYRAAHGAELSALREEAERMLARREDAAILAERTWAFPLYPRESLERLCAEIRRSFGVS